MQPFDPYYLYQPDERSNINTLFVSSLPDDVKAREIHNLFRRRPGFDSCQLKAAPTRLLHLLRFSIINQQWQRGGAYVVIDKRSKGEANVQGSSSDDGESDPDERSENGSDHVDTATTQRFIIQLILILFSIPQNGDAVVGSDNRVPVAREIDQAVKVMEELQGSSLQSSDRGGMHIEYARSRMRKKR
ncbi:hypothetical protein P8452_50566 [Trifolium repens]|nr:hypothetical protein P8452_50566 [Trifolium repens]